MLGFVVFLNQKSTATTFYVNDMSTKGDVYTLVIGNDYNDGLSPKTPKLSVLATYQEAKEGDLIYVDIGLYNDITETGELLFDNTKKVVFIIAGISDKVFLKKPFPANEKVSPTIFYIENDKPIEREVYMQRLQDAVRKK